MHLALRASLGMAVATLTIGAAPLPDGPGTAALAIDGDLPTPLTLSAAELGKLPATTVTTTIHGQALTCDGPRLVDVLVRAGLPGGDAVRGVALQLVVVATGADGYRTAFTLGELDPALGNASIIVGTRCNGAVLGPGDGPLRLIAAGDRRGARSVRQLVQLTVIQLGDARRP